LNRLNVLSNYSTSSPNSIIHGVGGSRKQLKSYPAKFFAMEVNTFFHPRENIMNRVAAGRGEKGGRGGYWEVVVPPIRLQLLP